MKVLCKEPVATQTSLTSQGQCWARSLPAGPDSCPSNTYLGNQLGSPLKNPSSRATARPPRFISVRCTQAMFFPVRRGLRWSQQAVILDAGVPPLTLSQQPGIQAFYSLIHPNLQHDQILHTTHKRLSLSSGSPKPAPFLVEMAQPNLWTVPRPWLTFPEIHSLEDVSGVDAIALSCLQELRDLLHLLEGHGGGLDLLHWGLPLGVQSIDELT